MEWIQNRKLYYTDFLKEKSKKPPQHIYYIWIEIFKKIGDALKTNKNRPVIAFQTLCHISLLGNQSLTQHSQVMHLHGIKQIHKPLISTY